MGTISIVLQKNLVLKLIINKSGLVGIGTTTPLAKLTVIGSSNTAVGEFGLVALLEGGTSATAQASLQLKSYRSSSSALGAFALQSIQPSTGNARALLLQPDGENVGIGTTTPDRRLVVSGGDGVVMTSLVNDATGYYACVNTTSGALFNKHHSLWSFVHSLQTEHCPYYIRSRCRKAPKPSLFRLESRTHA